MALNQSLQFRLLQKLSPQQIQLMKLLQVPTAELEQRIKQEIVDNPALEEGLEEKDEFDDENEEDYQEDLDDSRDDFDINDYLDDETPSYKTSVNNTSVDDDEKAVPLSGGASFHDILESQVALRIPDEQQLVIAHQIIGNLDESGYLRREVVNIVDDLAFSQNVMVEEAEVEEVLKIIQDLDPSGVGGRDLRECLLLQLKRKKRTVEILTAEAILEEYFEEFTKKHYKKILQKLDILEENLKAAIEEIVKLNPKPGNSMKETSKVMQQIIPDFTITEDEGKLELSLNRRNAPELKVSRQYADMLKTYAESSKSKQDKEAVQFIRQKIDSAKWFIDAIQQRQQTLLVTMTAIMNYQKEYFLTGDETKLKPMILKDIADIIDMDISTISRVANSKHVFTPYGTFLLKFFFSESILTDTGEEVSTREVKRILQDAIDNEDKKKPLTDEKLTAILWDKSYNIARRTVAKYREHLEIPVARLRKEL